MLLLRYCKKAEAMEFALIFLAGLATALLVLLALRRYCSFSAQSPSDYAGTGPDFDIRDHLNGALLCEGVIYGPTGRVSSRFVADMNTTWDGDTGVMTEDFRYDNGTEQHREWTLNVGDDGKITATAPDILGKGEGEQKGAGVQLRYTIRLPENAGGHVLNAVDWMYLVDNGTIINRSQFSKFGIPVAELVATIRRRDSLGEARMAAE